jgi:NADH dehydrogenase FAD-containing subunit
MSRLAFNGVKVITGSQVKEITEDGIIYEKEGCEETITGLDAVVLAVGVKPINKLAAEAKDRVPELHVIGDAKEQRKALDAITEGLSIGIDI